MTDWTEEQKRNAMTYGVCRECGSPLETRTWESSPHRWHHSIVCPNGHDHNGEPAPFDRGGESDE